MWWPVERSPTKSNIKPFKKKLPVSPKNLSFEVGDFAAAAYRSDYPAYIGQIKEPDRNYVFISFLQHSRKLCDSSTFC